MRNATIGTRSELKGHNLQLMAAIIQHLSQRFEALERWFDQRFGWFFTNGMKEQQQAERAETKA